MPAKTKTFLPTSTSIFSETQKRSSSSSEGEWVKRARKPKTAGWSKHKETVRGYYYELNDDWYVFVCVYKNEVRIHIRQYLKIDGNLVPTKIGATLWINDFEVLKKIGPESYKRWQSDKEEEGKDDIINHPLSDRSDYYLIIGSDQNGEVKFCVKICFQSPNSDALTSTNSGATLNLEGWKTMMRQLNEIDNSINEMQKFVVL